MIKNMVKNMIKWILTVIFLLYSSSLWAVDLKKQSIPQDGNLRSYSAIVGKDNRGEWQIVGLKKLPDGRYGFDLGTVTAIQSIEKVVWEAQPDLTYTTLDIEVAPYGSYTYTTGAGFGVVGYKHYLEYLTIVRNENSPIDYLSVRYYTNYGTREATRLVLGGEITPANPLNILQAPIPIRLGSSEKLIITNKSSSTQKLIVGIVTSWRKQ